MKKIYFLLFIFLSLVFLTGMAMRPKPKVYIQKLKNSQYKLIVDNKPFVVKGVCYSPIPVGQNHEYDWWQGSDKPWLADGKLMQEMGINTIRIYQAGSNPESVKQVIGDLYEKFGIRTILGSWLGFWEYPCPLYGDMAFQERIKKEVLEMVSLYKDEPGVLLWILGNENNFSFSGRVNPWSTDQIDKEPDLAKRVYLRAKTYYAFVNGLAKEIKKIDPDHPVALGNGELVSLDTANEACPDIDLVACIIYRGKTFGNLFKSLKDTFNRPILLSEFGADSYDAYLGKEDQNMQAFFLEGQWRQIYENLAGNKEGSGNCLGGVMFEWSDEWWKYNEADPAGWAAHDTGSNWSNGSYYFDIKAPDNKNMNEEWFGIIDIERKPRKSYYVIRDFWKSPLLEKAKNNKGKSK